MAHEMESMHHLPTLSAGVDASIARSWNVGFAQFVPSALRRLRKNAGRYLPEIGTWMAAKNPVCLIIKKRIYKNDSVQSDDRAVQEASLSIVVDGRVHVVHALRDLNLAIPKSWSPALRGRRVLVGSYILTVADNERTCFKIALRFADSAELKDCFASIKEALADSKDQDCRYAVALFDSNSQAGLDSPPLAHTNSQPSDYLKFGSQSTIIPAWHSKFQRAVQKNNPDSQVSSSRNKSTKRSLTALLLSGSEFQASRADKCQALLPQEISEPLVHFPRHHRVVAAANAQEPEYIADISELHEGGCLSEMMYCQPPILNDSENIEEVGCQKETYNLYKDKPSQIEGINIQRTNESMTHTAVQPSQQFEDPLSSQAGSGGLPESIEFRRRLLDCILDPSFRTLVKEVEYILLELERSSHTDVIAVGVLDAEMSSKTQITAPCHLSYVVNGFN